MTGHVKRKKAFTLIELLVVIAIFAILLTILLPQIGKLRRRAMETACMVDLKYLNDATMVHAFDNSQIMPDLTRNGPGGPTLGAFSYWTWAYWKQWYTEVAGVPRNSFYSVSNPKWNRDDFWTWGGPGSGSSYVVMGRIYFAAERYNTPSFLTSLKNQPPDVSLPLFPRNVGGSSYYSMVWSDLNRQYPSGAGDNWVSPGDPNRWGANHLYTQTNWPEVSHVAHVDGSVTKTPGSEIKHRVTWNGAEIYW